MHVCSVACPVLAAYWTRHCALIAACWWQEGSVYDYSFEKSRLQWKHWLELAPPAAVPETTAFTQIIVPTLDTTRYSHLMQLLVTHGKHVLFAGPTGATGTSPNHCQARSCTLLQSCRAANAKCLLFCVKCSPYLLHLHSLVRTMHRCETWDNVQVSDHGAAGACRHGQDCVHQEPAGGYGQGGLQQHPDCIQCADQR